MSELHRSSLSSSLILIASGLAAALAVSACSEDSLEEGTGGDSGKAGTGSSANGGGNTGGGDPGIDPIDPKEDPKEQGLVPMFVATGHMGRSVISCDDGKTWIANRAFDTDGDAVACGVVYPTRCNTTGYDCPVMKEKDGDFSCTMTEEEIAATPDAKASCDCTHHPGSNQGLAYGNGVWVSAWGWGGVATVRRTGNGVSWEVVRDGMDPTETFDVKTYTGVGFGNDLFLLGDRSGARSSDYGATWEQTASAGLQDQVIWPNSPSGPTEKDTGPQTVHNAREFGFADGVWILTGSSSKSRTHDMTCAAAKSAGFCDVPEVKCEDKKQDRDGKMVDVCLESAPTKDILVSSDDGDSWTRPEPLPRECGNGDILGGNGVAVIAMSSGKVCYSTDQGQSFAVADIGGSKTGTMIFDGEQFVTWTSEGMVTSSDAQTWSAATAFVTKPDSLGPVAYNPETGRFVSIKNNWGSWYGDGTEAYRSDDGITWETISGGDGYPAGHSIQNIAFGYGKPTDGGCPAL